MKCMCCGAEMKKDGEAFVCPICEAVFNKGLWVMPANGEDAERIQKNIRKEFKRNHPSGKQIHRKKRSEIISRLCKESGAADFHIVEMMLKVYDSAYNEGWRDCYDKYGQDGMEPLRWFNDD